MMKKILQPGLVLLGIAVIISTFMILPHIFEMFPNASYRFVLFFIVIVIASNVLAKITLRFVNS